MVSDATPDRPNNPEDTAEEWWRQGNYARAAELFEEAIAANPTEVSHYWHLGLMLLLQEQEAEAQMVWALVLSESDPEEVEHQTGQLIEVLQAEAQGQEAGGGDRKAWLIRHYIKELAPENLDNLLRIIPLSIRLENLASDEGILAQIITLLQTEQFLPADESELLQVLQQILEAAPTHPEAIAFVEALLARGVDSQSIYEIILHQTAQFINQQNLSPAEIIKYAEFCWRLDPTNRAVLASLAGLYQNVGNYTESIKQAQHLLDSAETIEERLKGYYLILKSLLNMGGSWQPAAEVAREYRELLGELMESNTPIEANFFLELMGTLSFPSYLRDEPENTHQFRNRFAEFYQKTVKKYLNREEELYKKRGVSTGGEQRSKVLRIGYLSSCFYRHSVGWLSRWLLKYHDGDRFEVHAYSLRVKEDNLQTQIARITNFTDLSSVKSPVEIAEAICGDNIDVLVDLDSLTHRLISPVLALKPAPIQVTWLGSDASGLPAVDYFIADSYVLPASAGEYYRAKIWRLPQVYVAVDGFEVGVPTRRRDELGIPDDAVVYFSGQTGYKRNPENARSQLQIIKEVPNSYFLVKSSIADEASVKRFFEGIAAEVGVESDRLRFLPQVASEEIHRANLAIADVVLDTYPYNGATTTLETLWMGIPLVTRVGEQFAARNSYTMMKNVGVTEGIAWTDEEYVQWGIRLGKDAGLRQEIYGKLWRSRQTSPLWNAEQFTREMEQAYQQMWENYLKS